MKSLCSQVVSGMRVACSMGLLALAACNGTAVVTLTSSASQDFFLAYRVKLVSVQLQSSSASSASLAVLPTSTTVDLATLSDLSEVLGAATVAKGSYTGAVITVDYSAAQIILDDGSANGLALAPVDASGQSLGQVALTIALDPSDSLSIVSNKTSRLALDFKLAASNRVDLAAKTVIVTPLIAASALPTDAKQVRIRGPLVSVSAANLSYQSAVAFDDSVRGAGQLRIAATPATTYEINGIATTGATGMANLAALALGAPTTAYGTLTASDATTAAADGTVGSAANVSFAAAQVLAGSSVQGATFDRISGIVSARSGNTLTVENATLLGADGTDSFINGTTTVNISANTAVSVFGQGTAEVNGPQQITVGSSIDAFGSLSDSFAGNATLDASSGRVRLGTTAASGLVTALGSDSLTLGLVSLGGRGVGAFDFIGSGASPSLYSVSTAGLDLSNAAVNAPLIVTGLPSPFGTSSPSFAASSLLDATTIQSQLVVDWGAGTAAPFVTYDASAIDLDVRNSSIGQRHQIQVGAQSIDIVGLSSDPMVVPDPTASASVFAIGHVARSTVENFDTYAAFIVQVQAELNGTAKLVTGMTAAGTYNSSTATLSATSITLILND
jgi:hypothetical protein